APERAGEIVAALRSALTDDPLADEVCLALARWRPNAPHLVPELLALIRRQPPLGYSAGGALVAVDPQGDTLLPALREAIRDEEEHVRFFAVGPLRWVKCHREAARVSLRRALCDRSGRVRQGAAEALEKARPGLGVGPYRETAPPPLAEHEWAG